jgi:ankyrin repeat protein
MLAAENNSSPKIINYLINQGALLEFQNLLGENALLIAAGNNSNSSILIELLKYPFPPRLTNKNGYNILTLAAVHNKLDTLNYILDQNIIDINYQNLSGETALILSIKKQANQEILNALINIQNINFKLKYKNFKTAYNYIESINKYPKNHIYWKIQDLSQ